MMMHAPNVMYINHLLQNDLRNKTEYKYVMCFACDMQYIGNT